MNTLKGIFTIFVLIGTLSAIDWYILGAAKNNLDRLYDQTKELNAQRTELIDRISSYQATDIEIRLPPSATIFSSDLTGAERELQNTIIEIAKKNGLDLAVFAPVPIAGATNNPVVGFKIEAEASLSDVTSFLVELDQFAPALAIKSLWLRHIPAKSRPDLITPVYVRVTIWTFWQKPGDKG